ncbi:MAG TPA: dual specificity protein phosphatase family protein [Thermoanaerobaculia bacterium]|nr:dual specificity protein phosphatase family protein [Thermoanaerobaculia bacterium]
MTQILAAPAHRIDVSGVDNVFQVNASLFRGAQPSELGLAELKKLGITVVVNLRERGHDVESERKEAEALGLRYVSIPVGGWSAPAKAQVAEFLTLLRGSSGDKIFVHCHLGRDRTGVMIAAYRVAEQHWTAKQAIQEMHSAGFHSILQPEMWAFVEQLPKAFATDSVFLPFRVAQPLTVMHQASASR